MESIIRNSSTKKWSTQTIWLKLRLSNVLITLLLAWGLAVFLHAELVRWILATNWPMASDQQSFGCSSVLRSVYGAWLETFLWTLATSILSSDQGLGLSVEADMQLSTSWIYLPVHAPSKKELDRRWQCIYTSASEIRWRFPSGRVSSNSLVSSAWRILQTFVTLRRITNWDDLSRAGWWVRTMMPVSDRAARTTEPRIQRLALAWVPTPYCQKGRSERE